MDQVPTVAEPTKRTDVKYIKLDALDKKPSDGYKKWTTDIQDVEEWQQHGYNAGMLLENLVLVDIDSYNRKQRDPSDDVEAVKTLLGEPTRTVRSGSGGYHLIYDLTPGTKFKNSAFKKEMISATGTSKGIDLKSGPRSHATMPGSKLTDGREYVLISSRSHSSLPARFETKTQACTQYAARKPLETLEEAGAVIYAQGSYRMEALKTSGLDGKNPKRHRLAWNHACKLSDKLSAVYEDSDEVISFGASILQKEILDDSYVSTKISDLPDKGYQWCLHTMEKAYRRTRRNRRNPNYTKKWYESRATLLDEGWTPQQLAALEVIIQRCRSLKSTKFWISARQFKELSPVADYSLMKFLEESHISVSILHPS